MTNLQNRSARKANRTLTTASKVWRRIGTAEPCTPDEMMMFSTKIRICSITSLSRLWGNLGSIALFNFKATGIKLHKFYSENYALDCSLVHHC